MNSTSRWIVLTGCIGLFAWFFADALFGSGMFVFRDAAHFYYPLFQLIRDEWAAGRVPLWNPYENLGQPLAGNPTASVFYPGKLIFALPLDYAWAYKIYVMAHVLLAAAAAYRLARHFDASANAAGVCAISYAFSGNVLFQYCNVVFLVGAAWLPLAMLAADRMLVERSPRRAVVFGVVLALMVLGGDPQMAYNAGLLAAVYALWLWRKKRGQNSFSARNRNEVSGSDEAKKSSDPFFAPALLALAAAAGLILSAVQVLPSMEFARHSGRHTGHTVDSLLGKVPEPGTHGEHVYHFSVGPWRLAEYVWPNVSGRQFPIHRRWLCAIPAEGRIWVPSLYMGLLPLLLALAAMRLRQKRCQEPFIAKKVPDTFFTWTVVLAVVASFGLYGLGWLVQEIRAAAGGDPAAPAIVGGSFGGLYWLMTLLLPGYAYFRYPAKLLVVAALGLSLLAARGWDRTFAGPSQRFRRGLLWLGGLSTCGAIVALAIRPFWHDWLFKVEGDVLFGPLDTSGAANDLLWAFAQTAVLCGLFWWLLGKRGPVPFLLKGGDELSEPGPGEAKKGPVPFVPAVALVLVAVDLAVANGWMVACAPQNHWREPSKLAVALEKRGHAAKKVPVPFSPRAYRHPIWLRPGWRSSRSPERLAEAMQWDRDTLWPKYNLIRPRVSVSEVYGTILPYDYEVFLRVGKRGSVPFSLAEYVILPGNQGLPPAERMVVGVEDVSLWHNARHLPRAWIVHQEQVDVLPPLQSHDPAAVQRRTEEVLYPQGRPRDLRNSAVVESGGGARPALPLATSQPQRESCRVTHYDPLRVEIETELHRPGLVVLCDQFYPGWQLEVKKRGQNYFSPEAGKDGWVRCSAENSSDPFFRVLRTNRVMRGVWLPAGHHWLTYRYRPASLLCGAIISGLGWIGIGLGLGWRFHKRRAANR